jgi:hypothetical protein
LSNTSSPTSKSVLDAIPDSPLVGAGLVTLAFCEAGYPTLRRAFDHVWRLPYGRNADAANPLAPLAEGRATCSTKHALLARLAAEQSFDVELCIGIYLMREANTPGVGEVLAQHGLDAIPEAHCYLVRDKERIDLTRYEAIADEPIGGFLHEEPIVPDQVGEYKRSVHRAFLASWAETPDANGLSADELWTIREECIAALAE